MPALGKAREMAKRTLCGANQKQISSAFILYSNEYGIIVHDRGLRPTSAGSLAYKITNTTDQAQRPWDSALAAMWTTKGNDSAKKYLECPSDKQVRGEPQFGMSGVNKQWFAGGEAVIRSYAPNGSLYNGLWSSAYGYSLTHPMTGNGSMIPTKVQAVKKPTSTVLLGEVHKGKNWNNQTGGMNELGNVQGTNIWEAMVFAPEVSTAYRGTTKMIEDKWHTVHKAGSNFTFVDGHVSWYSLVKNANATPDSDGQVELFTGLRFPFNWQWNK